MALLSVQQEYDAVREAIQTLSTGASVASINLGGMSVSYSSSSLSVLINREQQLARMLSCRNRRKRTSPDFSC